METEILSSELMNTWIVDLKNASAIHDELLNEDDVLNIFVSNLGIIICKHRNLLLINIIRERQLGTFQWILFCWICSMMLLGNWRQCTITTCKLFSCSLYFVLSFFKFFVCYLFVLLLYFLLNLYWLFQSCCTFSCEDQPCVSTISYANYRKFIHWKL